MTELTVIIPALNESTHLNTLLTQLRSQQGVDLRIIVSDGGSTDDSEKLCAQQQVQFVLSPKGRARQMNHAVKHCDNELLLFLHADSAIIETDLLQRAVSYFQDVCEKSGDNKVAGHFALKFIRSEENDGHNLAFRYMEDKTTTNRSDTINGDQGLLIHKTFLQALGGFDESMHFLEDQKISHRIFQRGQWVLLPGLLYTSARRFESAGIHRLYILMSIIMGLYHVDLKAFFQLSPQIYQDQKDSGKLLLTPFFKLIWKINLKHQGLSESLKSWYEVGRYIRSHSWQLFYFIDQLLRPLYRRKIFPLLKFHDSIFYPLTNNPPCNLLTALIAHLWFMWVLFPYFLFVENVFSPNADPFNS